MKKRLRKKKHLGEFKELGFEVRGDLRPGLAGDDINENGPGDRSPRPLFTSGSPACARGDLWAPHGERLANRSLGLSGGQAAESRAVQPRASPEIPQG